MARRASARWASGIGLLAAVLLLNDAALVFAAGTMLTKAHHTAELLAGFLIAYSVRAWVDRRRSAPP